MASPAAGKPHWAESYFGDLYLDSVRDLLGPRLSALEAGAVARLLGLAPGARVLDLACGHGRHAWPLAEAGAEVTGLDRSAPYLRLAREAAVPVSGAVRLVRGDLRALPFADGTFDAAFSWYASLFIWDDPANEACLAEAGRAVRPGGRLLVQHADPLRLALEPVAEARRVLPDGSVVEERSTFDPSRGVDRCARRVTRADGAVLAGTAELRYYKPSEWGPLAARAGLRLSELTTTAQDLIALLERPK